MKDWLYEIELFVAIHLGKISLVVIALLFAGLAYL